MFLSQLFSVTTICQQFSFCHIVCFHVFERFTRYLQQALNVQQFLLTFGKSFFHPEILLTALVSMLALFPFF